MAFTGIEEEKENARDLYFAGKAERRRKECCPVFFVSSYRQKVFSKLRVVFRPHLGEEQHILDTLLVG